MKFYIYFLLLRKKVVYIGFSKDVHVRHSGHTKKNHDSVRFIECESKFKALEYEKRWIKKFKPIHNINGSDHSKRKPQSVRSIEVHQVKNKSGVRISFTLDNPTYDTAIEIAKREGRPLGNYLTWSIYRAIKNDTFVGHNFITEKRKIMKIAV
ncbi:MAG TPA: hypothetical protein VIY47_08785 [Ignavibacteriaceae bacterium]